MHNQVSLPLGTLAIVKNSGEENSRFFFADFKQLKTSSVTQGLKNLKIVSAYNMLKYFTLSCYIFSLSRPLHKVLSEADVLDATC